MIMFSLVFLLGLDEELVAQQTAFMAFLQGLFKKTWWQASRNVKTHPYTYTHTHTHTFNKSVLAWMMWYDTSADKRSANRLQHEFILGPSWSVSDLGFRGNTRTEGEVLDAQLPKTTTTTTTTTTLTQMHFFFFLSNRLKSCSLERLLCRHYAFNAIFKYLTVCKRRTNIKQQPCVIIHPKASIDL